MKKVELYLKYLNKLKSFEQSIDIYFNDIDFEFVVKVSNNLVPEKSKHFRGKSLKVCLDNTCEFLLKEV